MQFSWEKQNGVLSFAIATPPVFVYGNTARQITLNITDNGQPYIASGVWSILMSIRNPQEFSGVPLAEATTFTAGFPFGVYTTSIDLYTTELEAYMSNQAQRGGLLQFTLTLPDGTTSSMAIPCAIQNYTANPNAGTPTNLPDAEAWLTARAVRYDIVQTLSGPQQAQARANIGAGVGGGSVTSVGMTVPSFLSVAGSPVTTSGTLAVTLATQVANRIFAGPSTGVDAAPTFRTLVAADLPVLTASRAVASDGSGLLTASATTATELGYVNGVTSDIQTQLNAKQATGNYITALTGDVTASGPGSAAAALSNTGVVAASYTNASITVDSKGRLTAASSGTAFDPASPGPIGGTTPSTGAFTALTLTPAANTTGLTLTGGTITGSGTTPFASITGTWNTTGAPTALKINITNTASAATAAFADWTLDGGTVDQVRVDKNAGILLRSSLLTGNYVQCTYSGSEVTVFTLTRGGNLTAATLTSLAGVFAEDGSFIGWGNRVLLQAQAAGVMTLYNNAATDFGRLQFGGTTTSFPAIKRSSAILQARLADDSAFTSFQCILRTTANAVAEVIVPTHTVVIQDASGTSYKVPVVAA